MVTNIIAGGTPFMPRNKRDGTVPPTTSDDQERGFLVGSRWWDTTNKEEYVLLDKTTGAAQWYQTTVSTLDLHSGFIDIAGGAEPANPNSDVIRLFVELSGPSIFLRAKDELGVVRTLATWVPVDHVNTLPLNWIE